MSIFPLKERPQQTFSYIYIYELVLLYGKVPGSGHKMCKFRIFVDIVKLSSRKFVPIYSSTNHE